MHRSPPAVRSPIVAAGLYLAILLGAIAAFLLIRSVGETLVTDAPAEPGTLHGIQPAAVDVVFHVLATLSAIIALGHLLSIALRWLGQPPVIGEVLAGIVLGPSVLGAISPAAMHLFIPSSALDPSGQVVAALKTIAQLGIVLYMFLIGLDLNTARLGRQTHAAVAISHVSIIAPFVLGAALALWLYPRFAPAGVPFTSFSLFLGVAMAITAFPVLARILTDRGLEKSDLGVLALGCAATDDVTAWCLLALVVGVAQAQVGNAILVFAGAAAFMAGMFFIVKPIARRMADWFEQNPRDAVASPGLFVAVLVTALFTEAIGIHAVFGAFLMGVVIPHESRVARELSRELHGVVTVLMLPAFFAITGMNTQIGLIYGMGPWITCAVVIAVATLGKFGGTLAAARFVGLDWTTSSALGVLMNTRGLMELIVLNIGLSLGVISPALFAMMVIMALVTTAATSPILQVLKSSTASEGA